MEPYQATLETRDTGLCYVAIDWASSFATCPTGRHDDVTQPSSTWTTTACDAATQPQRAMRLHNPLPPPGNTVADDSPICLQLTDVGHQQSQWIANYLTMKNQARKIWLNLRSACGRDLRDEPAFTVQRPIAVPTRTSHSPRLPIAETDSKIAINLEHALGLTDIPVGSRRTDVVTPGFQNSSVAKGGSVCLDSNLCDLDDLMTPWSTSTTPSLDHIPDLHPDLPPRLLHGHCEGIYDVIEVYTDGSFASHVPRMRTIWLHGPLRYVEGATQMTPSIFLTGMATMLLTMHWINNG